jgi:hypothetical protein
MTNYQIQQLELESEFVKKMLFEYGIREVTTQRQAKNGTSEFEFPVPCYTKERLKWFEERNKQQSLQLTHSRPWFPSAKSKLKDLPRLRIACFKSGYVRKQNGADRAYQLNPTYEQNYRCVWQRNNGELYVSKGVNKARALIHSPITRLKLARLYIHQ